MLAGLKDRLEDQSARSKPARWSLGILPILALISPFLSEPVMAAVLLAYGLLCLSDLPRLHQEISQALSALRETLLRRKDRDHHGGPVVRPRAALPRAA
ncbi:hypothetical protein [Deinococcus sp. QL22]|uniref:hypothetical protein n=1 Tax=Deinococcus sp. QL22 TaxID=2939437 RepID=UPI002017CFC3|nr:hypothetical protein [Deinococcus sp. QL22]UQN08846.1 hypothetical protein M1R55_19825 [Deinococcus sp. QL22]